jgi:dUTP pyrophosphatase
MELKVKLEEWAKLPDRAHPTDAGADIFAPHDVTVPARGSAVVDTGVHVQLPPGTVGMLKSKSGLNVKYGIVSDGVIDEGYTGSVVVKLYNLGNDEIMLSDGMKITQLVVMPVLYPDVVEVDEIGGGPRGDAGFGSTDERG